MKTQMLTMAELESFDRRSPKSGSQRRFLCPECGINKPKDSAHRSLAVNTNNGVYICHRCQTKGKLKEFWEDKPKLSKKQRTDLKLMSHFSIECKTEKFRENSKKQEIKKHHNLSDKMELYKNEFSHSPAEMYLDSRSICTNTAHTAQSGYSANWEHWEKVLDKWNKKGTDRRVVFPIFDENESLVAVHARAIDENYINSSKITRGDKSKGVFMTDADIFSSDIIAITEAPIDALALRMCGIPAIALIGTSSPDWIYQKFSFKSVLIATDADQAGDKIAFQLQENLANHCAKTLRLRPRKHKDWAEVLEKIGYQKMSCYLKAFSTEIKEEERFTEALKLLENKRRKSADFICDLIKDSDLKYNFLQRSLA